MGSWVPSGAWVFQWKIKVMMRAAAILCIALTMHSLLLFREPVCIPAL